MPRAFEFSVATKEPQRCYCLVGQPQRTTIVPHYTERGMYVMPGGRVVSAAELDARSDAEIVWHPLWVRSYPPMDLPVFGTPLSAEEKAMILDPL